MCSWPAWLFKRRLPGDFPASFLGIASVAQIARDQVILRGRGLRHPLDHPSHNLRPEARRPTIRLKLALENRDECEGSPEHEFCTLPFMSDIRFQSLEDGDLADLWYALGGAAVRHPDHFEKLMNECFKELSDRRGAGLDTWLEERFRPFRLADSKEDAEANLKLSPEARI
jgi:hypothetical protein